MPIITVFIAIGSILLLLLTIIALRRGMHPLIAFIICMVVALIYLFPELLGPTYGEMPEASGFRFKKIGERCERKWDCSGGCCIGGECEDTCGQEPSPATPTPIPILPPSISGNLHCSQVGINGWCVGSLSLDLTASDPQGLAIIITGKVNGTDFACPAGNTFCSVPLPEGTGIANYLVTSTAQLTASGSLSYRLDTTAPQINGSLNGSSGANGWYISNVIASASAGDTNSGLAAVDYSLDNGPWTPYGSALTLADGFHTVSLRARDQAGNRSETGQSFSIDTSTPALDLSLTGTVGNNGWYKSNVQVAATANDSVSGLTSLEYDLDHSGWLNYSGTLTLLDGAHSLSVRAIDAAGNLTQTDQQINIDTLTPVINLSTNGTTGASGWYVSGIQVNASSLDNGSGLASFEYSLDDGPWSPYTAPLSYLDGQYGLNFRAIDQAGNTTTTPVQTYFIDATPPVLDLTPDWKLGETAHYGAQDHGSGLSALNVAIEDREGRYGPITWEEYPTGAQFNSAFLWDGKFKGGVRAAEGTYFATIKASDMAGNASNITGNISVENGISDFFLPPFIPPVSASPTPLSVPTATTAAHFSGEQDHEQNNVTHPPQSGIVSVSDETIAPASAASSAGTLSFGGEQNPEDEQIDVPQTGIVSVGGGATTVTGISSEQNFESTSNQTPTPIPPSGILWGAAAAAALGAFIAEAQRREDEETAPVRVAREPREGKSSYHDEIRGRKLDAIEKESRNENRGIEAKLERMEMQETAQWQAAHTRVEKEDKAAEQDQKYNSLSRQERLVEEIMDAVPEIAKVPTLGLGDEVESRRAEAIRNAATRAAIAEREQQAAATAEAYERLEEIRSATHNNLANTQNPEINSQSNEKPWWDKAFDWIDSHQTPIALGIGVVVGIGAIALSGGVATPLVLAAAAAIAAGGVTAGTIGLNAYYHRPLGTNIINNVLVGAGAAVATAFVLGGGLQLAAIKVGNSIGAACMSNPAACGRVETILNAIDKIEEGSLIVKGAIQTWTGDSQGAADTAQELQMEYLDGGTPGNLVVKEIEELGDDAIEIALQYGDDAVPLLLQYGDDAIDIIGAYGDEGIALLRKFGDKTDEAIALVQDFGTPAVKVLDAVDLDAAKTLLSTLDDDVLDYAIEQGPDAVAALSRWGEDALSEHGAELALRAKNDAKVLDAVKKLTDSGPIDLKNLTNEQKDLIKTIAEYSKQYGDGGQIVLGKWVDLDGGFVEYAQDTGSIHYNPHPDMWNLMDRLGDNRDEVAWLVNKEVIQTSVEKGLPFEYTLNGIPDTDLAKEQVAIEAIFAGANDTQVMKLLRLDYVPVRMKELQELQKAGYRFAFDDISNSYIIALP